VVRRWDDARKHLGWIADDLRDTSRTEDVVEIRNFAKRQNLTPRARGVSLRNSASSSLPTPHSVKKKKEKEAAATPRQPVNPSNKDFIWSIGVEMLVAAGNKEASSRTFLGRLCNEHSDTLVAEALEAAVVAHPMDPKAWLAGKLKTDHRPSPRVVNGQRVYVTRSGQTFKVGSQQRIHWNTPEELSSGAKDGYEFPNGTICLTAGGHFETREETKRSEHGSPGAM
jgi:hypothetical protein